jgi:hypothetical protein
MHPQASPAMAVKRSVGRRTKDAISTTAIGLEGHPKGCYNLQVLDHRADFLHRYLDAY